MQVWGSRTGRVKGREQELAVLAGLDARLATRGGHSVALVGEPGVGVSALLGAFRRHAGLTRRTASSRQPHPAWTRFRADCI